jgi:uncharacterized membrane protein SpoIIM required for sporulation
MRVVERLSQREASWRELEYLIERFTGRRRQRPTADEILRLGELYRSACTDLMLADDHDLPRDMVAYLHSLVGRAHNVVYRATGFPWRDLGRALFQTAPRQLRSDPALRISALVFWVAFLMSAFVAAARPEFGRAVLGDSQLEQLAQMYAKPLDSSHEGARRSDTAMAGFYIQHNTGIGLCCFAWGILFGIGSLYQIAFQAISLGSAFGTMAVKPYAENFFTFVTAHSSFELTAIVVSAAAGLRMGWGLIETQGQTRIASLRREARNALPALGTAVVLFVLAAFVEGYVSASSLPYAAKAAVAVVSAAGIIAYLSLGGRSPAGGPSRPGDGPFNQALGQPIS